MKDVHQVYINFVKAFEYIRRESLWSVMLGLERPPKMVHLIKMCIEGSRCHLRIKGILSDQTEISSELKQWDALSLMLSNMNLKKVIRAAEEGEKGLQLNRLNQVFT